MSTRPLVSAPMVTAARADRFPWIVASLVDYSKQTYTPKEMVIVLDDPAPADRQRLEVHLADSGLEGVRVVLPGGKRSLRALRNVADAPSCTRDSRTDAADDCHRGMGRPGP